MTGGPLNPPPVPLATDPATLRIRFTHCNACEQPVADGDNLQVRTVWDPDTGEAWTVVAHIPTCPSPEGP